MDNLRPIVLIRGLLREQRHWSDFAEELTAMTQRPVICLDIAGNGLRNRETSANTIQAMSLDLQQQLDKQNFDQQSIDIVAISMGGMIALEWAQQKPQQVNSIVVINTSLRCFSPFYLRLRWQRYFSVIRALFSNESQREALIFALTSNLPQEEAKQTLSKWKKVAQQNPVSKFNAVQQLLAAVRFSEQTKPAVPCLVVSSKNDRLVSAKCSQAIAYQWQLPHLQHSHAGHDIPLDDGHWLVKQLLWWFQQKEVANTPT